MTTNVPPIQITSAGVIVPAEADILTGVQEDFNTAFGGGLNASLETPQGQLATSIAALIAQANSNLVALVAGVDPATSSGRMQDAIGRIYFMTRLPATSTAVTCTLTGLAGTLIPAGSQAKASDGNIYISVADVTIPAGGSIDTTFDCSVAGAIECPAGSLNSIYRAVPGWDTITNAADGVVGQNVESRYEFEVRRQQMVSIGSYGMLSSILAAVLSVSGVTDAFATENDASGSITVTGVTIDANAIYICVYGGTDADIGQAILAKKSPGCVMTGTTTVSVTDTNPAYNPNYPTYTIKFTRPTSLPIFFAVNIVNSVSVPADAETQIQDAIISAFAGNDGGPRARIGGTIFASRFYGVVAALGDWAQVILIQVDTASPAGQSSVLVPINQIPTIIAADITVTLV